MTQSTETVSQRAREAAAQRLERNAKDIPDHPMRGTAQMIRDGKLDGHSWVKEFARFERELSTNKDETIAKLGEALDDAIITMLAVRATAASHDYADSAEHLYMICGNSLKISRVALTSTKKEG